MRSLRARLFVFLLLLGVLASIAVGSATYVSVHEQADELFDYHLRQMALSLRDQGHITDAERAGLDNPELDYVVQVWSMDGVALYSSQPRESAPLPPRTTLGLSNVQAGGITWRVYGAATPARVVQVAQPLAVRRQLATSAAWRSVLPIVVAAPLLGLALWWLVGLMLAPLQRVVAAASRRHCRWPVCPARSNPWCRPSISCCHDWPAPSRRNAPSWPTRHTSCERR